MENTGRVKLHRKLLDNPIASNGNLLGFLCYLILSANHIEHSFYLGLEKIDQKPGQLIVSQKKLAKYFKVSISTISMWLSILKTETIIETKGGNKYTVVTLLNRDKYQGNGNQTESKPKANRKQTETIKNDKNDKNDNKGGRFAPPSVQEVKKYCQERKNSVNPEQFVNFYTSKGWLVGNAKMKDWKSAVRTWEQRQATNSPPKTKLKTGQEIEAEKALYLKQLEDEAGNRNK